MTATLYIVRHGNTFEKGEVVTRVGGRTDLPLSPSGEAQGLALARHFKEKGVVFSSARSGPLKRTRRTAELILAAQTAAPELTIDLFLREIDYGPDENRPETEVIARIGVAALEAWERQSIPPRDWRIDPAAVIGNWQETFGELRGARITMLEQPILGPEHIVPAGLAGSKLDQAQGYRFAGQDLG